MNAPNPQSASASLPFRFPAAQPQTRPTFAPPPAQQPHFMGMNMTFPYAQGRLPAHGLVPRPQKMDGKTTPIPKSKILRRGKWTTGEEKYAEVLIDSFKLGVLAGVPEGTTLRSLLAARLQCAPMRISKKYSGSSIGKMVYAARDHPPDVLQKYQGVLAKLDVAFNRSLEQSRSEGGDGVEMGHNLAAPPKIQKSAEATTKGPSRAHGGACATHAAAQSLSTLGPVNFGQASKMYPVPTMSVAPNGMMAVFIPFAPQLAPRFAPPATLFPPQMSIPQHRMLKGTAAPPTGPSTRPSMKPAAASVSAGSSVKTAPSAKKTKRKRESAKKLDEAEADEEDDNGSIFDSFTSSDDGEEDSISFEESLSALFPDDSLSAFSAVGKSEDAEAEQMLHWINDDPDALKLF